MKITKRETSAGSSERRKDAEDDASERRGRKSQKAKCRYHETACTTPPNLIAGMPHACRTPDSGHGD